MLKKFTCGEGVGPEDCEEGHGARAKPQVCRERRGWAAEQQRIKDTRLNLQPHLLSSPSLELRSIFRNTNMRANLTTSIIMLSFPNSNVLWKN